MMRSMLLGLALAVVGLSATANAAAMSFRGAVNGGAYNGLTYDLNFSVTDAAAAGAGNVTTSSITGGSLVFSNATTLTVSGGSVNFGDNINFNFNPNRDVLGFIVNFSNAQTLRFTYDAANSAVTNGVNLNNMYEFMYSFGPGSPFPGNGYANLVDVSSFGGGTGSVQAVPEPASMGLLALVTLGAGGVAYRRRKIAKK